MRSDLLITGIERGDRPGRMSGFTFLELAVVMIIFLVIALTVGTALGTGGEVYGEGIFRADLSGHARTVLNRILAEVEETQSNSPDFAVGTDFITYNRVDSLTATAANFGPERRIRYDANAKAITLTIADDGVSEELTGHASAVTFNLLGSRLTVTVSITKTNAHGTVVTQTVSGDVNVHR